MISNIFSANTIRLAKVTYVHPEGQKMEVMFLDNGDYGRDVQVMSPYAGTDFGFTGGIPSPEKEGHDENKKTEPDKRSIVAVIASLQGTHICLGFLFPQITQMAFTKDQHLNRMIERHPSDFYRTIDDAGNMDMVHPSGAYLTMSESGSVSDLTEKDFDKRWKVKKNTNKSVTITLMNKSGGGGTKVVLSPKSIEIYAPDNINIRAGKGILIQAGQDVSVKGAKINLN